MTKNEQIDILMKEIDFIPHPYLSIGLIWDKKSNNRRKLMDFIIYLLNIYQEKMMKQYLFVIVLKQYFV